MTNKEAIKYLPPLDFEDYGTYAEEAYNMAVEALEKQDNKGKWTQNSAQHWICNSCGWYAPLYIDTENGGSLQMWCSPFCPECGADMRGDSDETD